MLEHRTDGLMLPQGVYVKVAAWSVLAGAWTRCWGQDDLHGCTLSWPSCESQATQVDTMQLDWLAWCLLAVTLQCMQRHFHGIGCCQSGSVLD